MITEKKILSESGFTLVEMLVYVAIVAFFSVLLILNLQGAQTNSSVLSRASSAIISDFRRAQLMTIAGLTFQGNPVCGYGIHYLSSNSYLIYAGGEAVCSSANRNYQSGTDFDIQTVKITESGVEFKSSFSDVFFEPPDPKTYLNNLFSLSANPLAISVGFSGQSCLAGCQTINVFPSGKIDLQ